MRLPDSVSVLRAFGLLGILFLIVPVAIVLPLSFTPTRYLRFPTDEWSLRWYENLFTNANWYRPLGTSLAIATAVAILAPSVGLLAAYGLRSTRSGVRSGLSLLFLIPIFVPPVVLAVGLLLVYSRVGLVDTPLGLILGHTLLAFPYAFVLLSATLSRTNLQLEQAALTLGATPLVAFIRVTLPQLGSGLFVASALSFLVSFDEPVLALFLAGNRSRTLPRQLFDGIRYDLDPTSAAVAGLLIVIVLALACITVFGQPFRASLKAVVAPDSQAHEGNR